MNRPRLTVGALQISISDDGSAHYSPSAKTRAAVEAELMDYRDFIDRWLETSTEPVPRTLTEEEQELRKMLKQIAKLRSRFPEDFVETIMREVGSNATVKGRWPALTQAQIDDSLAEMISTL
jgi:hypothetical protein